MRRRFWCPRCRQRALFPVLHSVVHTLDLLRETAKETENREQM